MHSKSSIIILGGGCFWCTEAIFTHVPGVLSAEPGYAGGHMPHPTYDDVCTGTTGHAEVVRVTFDPDIVSLERILSLFFSLHNPTTLNQQGPDVGTQYRSLILWTDEGQKKYISAAMRKAEQEYGTPVTTEVKPFNAFYPAEVNHQQYYVKNPHAPYCAIVIGPKLMKLREMLMA